MATPESAPIASDGGQNDQVKTSQSTSNQNNPALTTLGAAMDLLNGVLGYAERSSVGVSSRVSGADLLALLSGFTLASGQGESTRRVSVSPPNVVLDVLRSVGWSASTPAAARVNVRTAGAQKPSKKGPKPKSGKDKGKGKEKKEVPKKNKDTDDKDKPADKQSASKKRRDRRKAAKSKESKVSPEDKTSSSPPAAADKPAAGAETAKVAEPSGSGGPDDTGSSPKKKNAKKRGGKGKGKAVAEKATPTSRPSTPAPKRNSSKGKNAAAPVPDGNTSQSKELEKARKSLRKATKRHIESLVKAFSAWSAYCDEDSGSLEESAVVELISGQKKTIQFDEVDRNGGFSDSILAQYRSELLGTMVQVVRSDFEAPDTEGLAGISGDVSDFKSVEPDIKRATDLVLQLVDQASPELLQAWDVSKTHPLTLLGVVDPASWFGQYITTNRFKTAKGKAQPPPPPHVEPPATGSSPPKDGPLADISQYPKSIPEGSLTKGQKARQKRKAAVARKRASATDPDSGKPQSKPESSSEATPSKGAAVSIVKASFDEPASAPDPKPVVTNPSTFSLRLDLSNTLQGVVSEMANAYGLSMRRNGAIDYALPSEVVSACNPEITDFSGAEVYRGSGYIKKIDDYAKSTGSNVLARKISTIIGGLESLSEKEVNLRLSTSIKEWYSVVASKEGFSFPSPMTRMPLYSDPNKYARLYKSVQRIVVPADPVAPTPVGAGTTAVDFPSLTPGGVGKVVLSPTPGPSTPRLKKGSFSEVAEAVSEKKLTPLPPVKKSTPPPSPKPKVRKPSPVRQAPRAFSVTGSAITDLSLFETHDNAAVIRIKFQKDPIWDLVDWGSRTDVQTRLSSSFRRGFSPPHFTKSPLSLAANTNLLLNKFTFGRVDLAKGGSVLRLMHERFPLDGGWYLSVHRFEELNAGGQRNSLGEQGDLIAFLGRRVSDLRKTLKLNGVVAAPDFRLGAAAAFDQHLGVVALASSSDDD